MIPNELPYLQFLFKNTDKKTIEESKINFCSLEGRLASLGHAVAMLFFSIPLPFMAINDLRCSPQINHKSFAWKILDIFLFLGGSLVIGIALTIRALAGAILHPALNFKEDSGLNTQ